MHQRWVNLLFLHWPMPPETVQRLLPDPLRVETFDGRAWVGLVPFRMKGIRLPGLPPLPGTSEFLELNLRTYASPPGGEPGVWFFSLDGAHSLAVRVARALWHLPYFRARMSEERAGARTRYRSERLWPEPLPARCSVEWEAGEPLPPSHPGDLAWFLTERYVLYARARSGGLVRGPIHHPRWQLRGARLRHLESDLFQAAGLPAGEGEPLAHYVSEIPASLWPIGPA